MIQRIQTVFLFVASVLSLIMLISPLAQMIITNGDILKFYSIGLKNIDQNNEIIYGSIPLFVLILVTMLISLIALFFYHKRTLQMRLCVYNILLMIGLIGLLTFYSILIKKHLGVDMVNHSFSFPVIFPIINIILIFQAFRGIRRDELLLKAYDRLR